MFAFWNARRTVMTSTSSSSTSRMFKTRSRSSTMMLSGPLGGPPEQERRALVGTRLQPCPPTMCLDDLAHDREPDTSALDFVPALERLEQPPDLVVKFGCDSHAVVAHEELVPRAAVSARADGDVGLTPGVVLDGV